MFVFFFQVKDISSLSWTDKNNRHDGMTAKTPPYDSDSHVQAAKYAFLFVQCLYLFKNWRTGQYQSNLQLTKSAS